MKSVRPMRFSQIVRNLTLAKLKTIYDWLGKPSLSAGFKKGHIVVFNGYKYVGNAFDIFENFNKTYLPFHNLYDDEGK